ncbi:MAG: hypothetical protein JW891_08710 [Candidatus Lokiarchaeota archaeon]|nr:hypothetical protein [Candidatus Lokiarchaeota archaeon]
MQDIKLWFQKAMVPLKIERDPLTTHRFGVNNRDVFQMSIDTRGKKKKSEYFRIYRGHEENDIRVIDANFKHQQVILMVKEPSRDYKVTVWNPTERKYDEVTQTTPDVLRKYLMGMDESHLFIAELPSDLGPINKVNDAHRILKPKSVAKREKNTNRIKRQGEWFFLPASTKELEEIEKEMNGDVDVIFKKQRIGKDSIGNSHIADELINTPRKQFVRGKICHIEHKTIKLHGWHLVEQNTEGRIQQAGSQSISHVYKWVD